MVNTSKSIKTKLLAYKLGLVVPLYDEPFESKHGHDEDDVDGLGRGADLWHVAAQNQGLDILPWLDQARVGEHEGAEGQCRGLKQEGEPTEAIQPVEADEARAQKEDRVQKDGQDKEAQHLAHPGQAGMERVLH